MKNKLALLFLILMLSITVSQAQKQSYTKELNIVFKSLKSNDYKLIKPLLDPNVKVGNLPQGMNDAVIPQVLTQLPKPVSFKVSSTIKEGDGTRINTVYTYADKTTRNQSFLFNAKGKIIDFDVLEGANTQTSTGSTTN